MEFCWMDIAALILLAAAGVVIYVKSRRMNEEMEELRSHLSK